MKSKIIRFSVLLFLLILTVTAVCSVFAEPGDEDDPVISLSYIQNKVIPELKEYIDSKISSFSASGGTSFEVVEVGAGKTVICEKSAELILRMGSASVIATEKGGLADTTSGFDLGNGEAMPANHLLIVPVNDGRGIKAETDIIVMIKGGFSIN